jgi:hypothetical protein
MKYNLRIKGFDLNNLSCIWDDEGFYKGGNCHINYVTMDKGVKVNTGMRVNIIKKKMDRLFPKTFALLSSENVEMYQDNKTDQNYINIQAKNMVYKDTIRIIGVRIK